MDDFLYHFFIGQRLSHGFAESALSANTVQKFVVPLSCLFCQLSADVFVQDARDKGLVWKTFVNGCFLEMDKISFSHSDVDSFVLP